MMLARSFLSADDLDLTKQQRDAMIAVLHMLERGELVHVPNSSTVPNGFNMAFEWAETECGTVGCIAGWCDVIGGTEFIRDAWPESLVKLFAPPSMDWPTITPAQAAIALSNFLTMGEPRWAEAMASDR
jgi:hypothetical protein